MYQVDTEKCDGCATCVDICPSEAVRIVDGKAQISDDDCVDCGSCEVECPNGSISVV